MRSPDQKVVHRKLVQKEARPSADYVGAVTDFNFVEERDEDLEFTPHLRNDDVDDEASPLIPGYQMKKSQQDASANNSLDISNIEMEG